MACTMSGGFFALLRMTTYGATVGADALGGPAVIGYIMYKSPANS